MHAFAKLYHEKNLQSGSRKRKNSLWLQSEESFMSREDVEVALLG